ncbi:hypothetical protein P12x_000122 [Tundrisphaera lichenicola]|uniref:hypothetical protein n=1 Tax=Tundrisphaera lichenicola TaxID=2029860 RepID=UPI003EBDBEB5
MTLRIMLVSLVASLGFELPSDHDLACWSHSGREWVAARLADFSGSSIEADQFAAEVADEPVATPVMAEIVKADDDRTFEVASEAMAADFAADLLAIQVENPGPDDTPARSEVAALAMVGVPSGEEAFVSWEAPAEEVVASTTEEIEVDATYEEEDEDSSAVDRLSTAVRLTREAVQAWADLIPESSDEAEPTY